jgi:hypothetical protein
MYQSHDSYRFILKDTLAKRQSFEKVFFTCLATEKREQNKKLTKSHLNVGPHAQSFMYYLAPNICID